MSDPCPFDWLGQECKPKHLYHYARWHWIRQNIADKTITLSDPWQCWDDPTEWLWTRWIKENIAPTVLAMCWTRTGRSEALWRLERSKKNVPEQDHTVVRIRTNFDRLSRAVAASTYLSHQLPGKSFLVPVQYLTDHRVARRFDQLSATKLVSSEAARALSYKRYPYRYEREVRWVHITEARVTERVAVRIDINAVIDQIMIDPRVDMAEADRIKVNAREAGFLNELKHSRLFRLPSRLRPFATRP